MHWLNKNISILQQHQTSDRAQDWADGTGAVPPASVSAEQLVLLDEILPLTPKQIWRLIYDMAFIQAFYKKKMYRETGIGGWQKTGVWTPVQAMGHSMQDSAVIDLRILHEQHT